MEGKDKDRLYPELEDRRAKSEIIQQRFLDDCEKFSAVFKEGLGLEVLGKILEFCHFGVTLDPDNPAQIAEYNLGITLLMMSGKLEYICTLLGIQFKKEE